MIECIIVFLCSLCWGSFLNVVAYRVTYDKPFLTARSLCPFCGETIFWYDNIPIISWLFLRGRCRFCKKPISILYPFIEVLSGLLFTALYFYIESEFIGYFIFFSALVVSVRTDLQAMVIPQLFSIWLVPVGVIFSYFGIIQISLLESVLGALLGYGLLWVVAKLFLYFTKKEGLGVGDMELLAMIGSFLGPLGVWFSLLLGSLVGLLVGGSYIAYKKKNMKIPFGPFLALGAIIYFFFKDILFLLFL